MSEATPAYSGREPAIEVHADPRADDGMFEVRSPKLPAGAVPMYDEELKAVIGYRLESTTGVYRIYDVDGRFITMEEEGLQAPLIDPIDLILIGGALIKGVAGLFRVGARQLTATGLRSARGLVGAGALTALRGSFRRVATGGLKFTATTSARMATKGRYVPIHILEMAVKFGTRAPDPQGVAGVFQYLIPMFRNGQSYTLKVVLREADRVVLHFHYF